MPVHDITIKLDKPRKIYHQGENLSGLLVIDNKYDLRHDGILLSLEGYVDIHFNFRSINFMDTFHGTNKTIQLVEFTQELVKPGRLTPGVSQIPFKIPIDSYLDRSTLYETYHGVFITIQYCVKCRIKRPIWARDIFELTEFFLEYDANPIGAPQLIRQPIKFDITPESLSASRRDIIPNFKITGQIDSSVCLLTEPVTGEFVIERCDAIIRSVELQLVRVETCGLTPGDRDYSRDSTEVQNIQIGDGNLLRNIPINIHMVLPRLFTCPTLITSYFRIEFEINLVIIFEDNYLMTENFPIKLTRSTLQPIDHL